MKKVFGAIFFSLGIFGISALFQGCGKGFESGGSQNGLASSTGQDSSAMIDRQVDNESSAESESIPPTADAEDDTPLDENESLPESKDDPPIINPPNSYMDDTFMTDNKISNKMKVNSLFDYNSYLKSGEINSAAYDSLNFKTNPKNGRYVLDIINSHFVIDNNDEPIEPNNANTNNGDPATCSNGSYNGKVYPTNAYPFGVRTEDVTVVGGVFHGLFADTTPHQGVPQNADWFYAYCNSAVVMFKGVGNSKLDGTRITSSWDAVRVGGKDGVIKNSWASNVRDDFIENDENYSVSSKDNLIDKVFAVFSSQRGSTNGSKNTTRIEGNVIRMTSYPYKAATRGPQYFGAFYKSDSNSPEMIVRDTVLAIEPDSFKPGAETKTFNSQWEIGWDKIKQCSNNILLWMPNKGDYSKELERLTDGLPNCFEVVTGADARVLWDRARKNWINCHPKVGRMVDDTPSNFEECRVNEWGGFTYAD